MVSVVTSMCRMQLAMKILNPSTFPIKKKSSQDKQSIRFAS